MPQTLRKIVNVLDGQPTGVRGQSLVEMTLTFPLLILMVLGLVEIGYVSNNYLILMDVVRSAGRAAITTVPDATMWDDSSATYPESRNVNRLDCDQPGVDPTDGTVKKFDTSFHRIGNASVSNTDPLLYDHRDYANPGMQGSASSLGPRAGHLASAVVGYPLPTVHYWTNGADGKTHESAFGFFDSVACQVTRGFAPLVFNDDDIKHSKDDIVISAVSYQLMKYTLASTNPSVANPAAGNSAMFQAGPGAANHVVGNTAYWVTVTGRFPAANRYCAFSTGSPAVITGDIRDPFDFLRNDYNNQWTNGPSKDDTNPAAGGKYGEGAYDQVGKVYLPGTLIIGPAQNQSVRGFVFTGNNLNDDGCYGSRFTVQEIENRLNLNDPTLNSFAPNGGMVIVEVFWQYHPLVFGPLFQGFNGSKMNDPVLWVWGMFPLPSVEPTATPSN